MSSQGAHKKPILSFILCSRNDQYQGNSLWRLQTALNYLGQTVNQLGRVEDIEVIVADWGSETPLHHVLKLSQEAARIVSFLLIPHDIAQIEQKDSPFPEVLALNAAARRAKGDYIGRIDQDILVGKQFLEKFFWMHEKQRMIVPLNKAAMISNRRRIPYRFATLCPSFWTVDRYLRWLGRFLPLMDPPPPHLPYQVWIGILLFHRDLWYECGGYDERFIYMDFMEFDITLRLAKQYTFVDIGKIVDFDFYHLDHYRPGKYYRYGVGRKANPIRTPEFPPEEINPNGDNWGLIRYSLELMTYPVEHIDAIKMKSSILLFEWLTFIGVLLTSSVQIVGDGAIIVMKKVISKITKGCSPPCLR